ncbi:MAG: ABC transporter ATP-binding protein [Anaerolineaceae bacterium]|jgi:branched-chain amino acid transport system ATP-binding protein|nr:ABC transporter ATP-binding protein [Anaerolineaceae bacterium]
MKHILEIYDATKKFGGLTANEGITFDVAEGEILGIVGPNGAGKTTLFNSLSKEHRLTRGTIRFNGVDVTKKSTHEICKMGIGRTFQIPQSIKDLTVIENVLVGALCHTNSTIEARRIAEEMLEKCGIMWLAEMQVANLNVAQSKRLEIARALATRPKLLLLDETMSGLTTTERAESLNLIREINSEGITVLTIEHNMDVIMNVSERVLVLISGKTLTIGTPAEVTSNEEVIDAYLGRPKHA